MLTVIFIMTPPVLILIQLFARPDPIIGSDTVAAQRRTQIAFFRNELLFQTVPVLTVFAVLVIMLHAVNVSMNPLYEPAPVPVSEAESKVVKIPFADKLGRRTEARKYVYYTGGSRSSPCNLKPTALLPLTIRDLQACGLEYRCQGWPRRAAPLICVLHDAHRPSATATPGCNPIPIPFSVQDGHIVIKLVDLTGIYDKTQALEKKGTHL
jgi:uncharacterized membrane protein